MVSQFHGKYSVEDFDRYFILFYATTLALPSDSTEDKEIVPEGLRLIQNFVGEEEEKNLIEQIVASEGDWEMYDIHFSF